MLELRDNNRPPLSGRWASVCDSYSWRQAVLDFDHVAPVQNIVNLKAMCSTAKQSLC
jgi:hypothetical protein